MRLVLNKSNLILRTDGFGYYFRAFNWQNANNQDMGGFTWAFKANSDIKITKFIVSIKDQAACNIKFKLFSSDGKQKKAFLQTNIISDTVIPLNESLDVKAGDYIAFYSAGNIGKSARTFFTTEGTLSQYYMGGDVNNYNAPKTHPTKHKLAFLP